MVDARVSKTRGATRAGSSPALGTYQECELPACARLPHPDAK